MTSLTRPSLTAAQADRGPVRGTAILAGVWTAFWLLMIWAAVQDALRNPAIAWWEPVLLRASLRTVGTEMTPLREELRLLALYAEVMSERFRDRVVIAWDVDEAVGHVPVPALLLQPLLENVFKHGVERTGGAVAVVIEARGIEAPAGVEVTVRNSGATLWPGHRDGMGLRNYWEGLRSAVEDYAALRSVRLSRLYP